jgi:dCTP deaminase
MPLHRVGFVMGKSSWAREGLLVEAAGLVDPGFTGEITLELSNLTDEVLEIEQGLRIAQLCVAVLDAPTAVPYWAVGHYNGQSGPTPSWKSLRK